MSELEIRLLEFWKADAVVWRKRTYVFETQKGPPTLIDKTKEASRKADRERRRQAAVDAQSMGPPRARRVGRRPGTPQSAATKQKIRTTLLARGARGRLTRSIKSA